MAQTATRLMFTFEIINDLFHVLRFCISIKILKRMKNITLTGLHHESEKVGKKNLENSRDKFYADFI